MDLNIKKILEDMEDIRLKNNFIVDYDIKTHRGYDNYIWVKLTFNLDDELLKLGELRRIGCEIFYKEENVIGIEISEMYSTIILKFWKGDS